MTDRIREKMNAIRIEADNAVNRAEEAEAKCKKLEQTLLERDQEITSLQHKLSVLDTELEKTGAQVDSLKAERDQGAGAMMTNEGLLRKVSLLEEELDAAEKNLKDTVDKLRQVDVKAEHFERQVSRVEQERDAWEKKFENEAASHAATKKELDDLAAQLENI